MHLWSSILAGFWIVLCTFNYALVIAILLTRRTYIMSRTSRHGETNGRVLPRVRIIIPARNEEADLATCLNAVMAQDYPDFAVTIVDDRSDDGTLAIASRYGENDDRIQIIPIDQLPQQWLGKSHALWTASETTDAEWLLFIDVDLQLAPDAVRAAVTEALDRKVDLLTLWPRMSRDSVWQCITIPYCSALLCLWFNPLFVNSRKSRVGFANGQFVLIRRDAYLKIDGHRSVRRRLIEDVPFGQVAKQAGLDLAVLIGIDFASVRMYRTVGQMFNGWTRIFAGALRSRLKLILTLIHVLLTALPVVAAPLLLFTWLSGGAGLSGLLTQRELWVLSGICAASLVANVAIAAEFWQMAGCGTRYVLAFPIALVATGLMICRAVLWLTFGSTVTWRGTGYQIDSECRITSHHVRAKTHA